jgi:hypothetical protein
MAGEYVAATGRPRLGRMILDAAQWLLPWICVLTVSATTTAYVDHALTRDLGQQEPQANDADTSFRWVTHSSIDNAGTVRRVACLTSAEIPASRVTDVSRRDLDKLVVHLSCSDVWID